MRPVAVNLTEEVRRGVAGLHIRHLQGHNTVRRPREQRGGTAMGEGVTGAERDWGEKFGRVRGLSACKVCTDRAR